jgi:hypothetical protein
MNEIWLSVENYVGYYEVSNYGNVRSTNRTVISIRGNARNLKSKLLKPATNRDGYLQIAFCINGKSFSNYIHVIVAKAFILNPENKPTVNHKDGIKINNFVDNLEWSTKSEQAIHALSHNLRKMPNVWNNKFGSEIVRLK